jgi:DNA-binding response OmpR family regulator
MKVLVASRDAETGRAIAAGLVESGHRAQIASDSVAAVATNRSSTPDAVLLDACMTRVGGYDICGTLRRDAGTGRLAIVLLGDGLADGPGADGVVHAPLSPAELVRAIEKAVASRAACVERHGSEGP